MGTPRQGVQRPNPYRDTRELIVKRGTPLRRARLAHARDTHLSRREGLSPRSNATVREYQQRRALVARLLEQRPWCEIRVSLDLCNNRAVDVDEILSRAQGGSILDESNLQTVCRPCHRYKHEHPAEAVERGWTIQRSPKSPRTGPVEQGEGPAGPVRA